MPRSYRNFTPLVCFGLLTARIKRKTTINNQASVTADIIDINAAGNSATLEVSVGAGGKSN